MTWIVIVLVCLAFVPLLLVERSPYRVKPPAHLRRRAATRYRAGQR